MERPEASEGEPGEVGVGRPPGELDGDDDANKHADRAPSEGGPHELLDDLVVVGSRGARALAVVLFDGCFHDLPPCWGWLSAAFRHVVRGGTTHGSCQEVRSRSREGELRFRAGRIEGRFVLERQVVASRSSFLLQVSEAGVRLCVFEPPSGALPAGAVGASAAGVRYGSKRLRPCTPGRLCERAGGVAEQAAAPLSTARGAWHGPCFLSGRAPARARSNPRMLPC